MFPLTRFAFFRQVILIVFIVTVATGCGPAATPQPTAALPSPFLPTAAISPTLSLPSPVVIVASTPTSLPPTLVPTDAAAPTTAAPQPTAASAPTQPPITQSSGPYVVVNVPEGSTLVVHETPSIDSPHVAALKYNDTGMMRTGRSEMVAETLWWELSLANGKTGWVNSTFLSEEVAVGTFCSDERIKTFLSDLKRAYNTGDGKLYSSLISQRHGLDLTYLHTGKTANFSTEEAKFVFGSSYVTNWGMHPASGLDVNGTFHEEVLPKLIEVFNAPYTLTCNAPGPGATNYPMSWPGKYENIRYMALYKPGTPGVDLDWRVWLIGFEYIEGKPYLFSMIHFFWEP